MMLLLYHLSLFSACQETIPFWMNEAIEKDFSSFTGSWDIETTWGALKILPGIERAGLVRIHMKNGQIAWEPLFNLEENQQACLQNFLFDLKEFSRYTLDLILCANLSFDRPIFLSFIDFPIFVFNKEIQNHKAILVPPHLSQEEDLLLQNLAFPWNEKIAKAFWRGSTSDSAYSFFDWDFSPRARLALLSVPHRDILDARLLPPTHPSMHLWLDSLSILSSFVPPQEQKNYKYLIALDGKTAPSSFIWELFTGSLVLKADSQYTQWFYPGLIENVHYVSIRPTGGDLIKTILWLLSHDEKAYTIATQSIAFAKQYLNRQMRLLYLEKVLETLDERLIP